MYRIYIFEGRRKFYLMDIIVTAPRLDSRNRAVGGPAHRPDLESQGDSNLHDDMEHPQFGVDWSHAMTFPNLRTAMNYRQRLIDLNYQPHIE